MVIVGILFRGSKSLGPVRRSSSSIMIENPNFLHQSEVKDFKDFLEIA